MLQPRAPDYLAEGSYAETYGRLHRLVHAPNPFAPTMDYAGEAASLERTRAQIVNLLNAHVVHLVDVNVIWTIRMMGPSQRVQWAHWSAIRPS